MYGLSVLFTLNSLDLLYIFVDTDEVPRTLIDPNTAQMYDVSKYYWCNADTMSWRADDIGFLVDQKGNRYQMNKAGFVVPCTTDEQEQKNDSANDSEEAE